MSKTVSTFELLFARQIASGPPGTAVSVVSRRVIQGYFLTIANLESSTFNYRVTLQMTPTSDPAGPPLFVVRVGTSLSTPGIMTDNGGGRYSLRATVGARETALVGIFPPTLLSALGNPGATEYQSRGYVSISLPAKLALQGGKLKVVPQSKKPVTVMLTPDLRGTFLPNAFSDSSLVGDFDFDQTFATLPVAGGSSELELPPEPPFVLPSLSRIEGLDLARTPRLDLMSDLLADLTADEQAGLLQALMASMADETTEG